MEFGRKQIPTYKRALEQHKYLYCFACQVDVMRKFFLGRLANECESVANWPVSSSCSKF